MRKVNVIDEVQLKHEFRQLQKEIGFEGMRQVLYELMLSVELCLEVMKENTDEEKEA